MDDKKETYFKNLGWDRGKIDEIRRAPDLEERRKLRRDLQCRSFDWYLEEVVEKILNIYDIEPYFTNEEKSYRKTLKKTGLA